MARLSEIYNLVPKNSKDKERIVKYDNLIQFSVQLNLGLAHAKYLLKHYGANYIYTHTGMALPYSESAKKRLLVRYGAVVVVDGDFNISVFKASKNIKSLRAESKRERIAKRKREEAQEKAEMQKLIEEREREEFFTDMQKEISHKRAGRANSHSDIGKYKNFRSVSVHHYEPKSVDKFVVIRF